MAISQLVPVKPVLHVQEYEEPSVLEQKPFWHGLELQGVPVKIKPK